MRWLPTGGVVAGVIALNLAGGAAIAAAAPKPQDVTAARTVVRAITRFDQAALGHQTEMNAAARAVLDQVRAGCAGGIPASAAHGTTKQQYVTVDLLVEGSFDASLRAFRPIDHAALAFSNALGRVHFSKRALTRRIHDTANGQRSLLAVTPPDLCADVKAGAANGFTADPPGTIAFRKGIERLDPGPMDSVTDMIKQFRPDLLTKSDRAALRRLQKVQAQYVKYSVNFGLKWGTKLVSVLTSAPRAGGTGSSFPTNPPA